MTVPQLQAAIDFLEDLPELTRTGQIPPNAVGPATNYADLAALAAANGHVFAGADLPAAFRIFMRARLLAAGRPGLNTDRLKTRAP